MTRQHQLGVAHHVRVGLVAYQASAAIVLLCSLAKAAAQDPPPAPPPSFQPSDSPLLEPGPAHVPKVEGELQLDQVDEAFSKAKERALPALELGGYVTVPTFFSGINDIAATGFGFAFHAGYDMGVLVPEVYIGSQFHDLEANTVYPDNLNRSYFSFGLKLEANNESIVTPFIGASVDFNWWSQPFRAQTVCGYAYCYLDQYYSFAPGFTGRAGMSIMPKPTFSIDLGVEIGMSFQGQAFFHNEAWVGPIIGMTGRLPVM